MKHGSPGIAGGLVRWNQLSSLNLKGQQVRTSTSPQFPYTDNAADVKIWVCPWSSWHIRECKSLAATNGWSSLLHGMDTQTAAQCLLKEDHDGQKSGKDSPEARNAGESEARPVLLCREYMPWRPVLAIA